MSNIWAHRINRKLSMKQKVRELRKRERKSMWMIIVMMATTDTVCVSDTMHLT